MKILVKEYSFPVKILWTFRFLKAQDSNYLTVIGRSIRCFDVQRSRIPRPAVNDLLVSLASRVTSRRFDGLKYLCLRYFYALDISSYNFSLFRITLIAYLFGITCLALLKFQGGGYIFVELSLKLKYLQHLNQYFL